jgi:hypothetical protein
MAWDRIQTRYAENVVFNISYYILDRQVGSVYAAGAFVSCTLKK